MNDAVDSISGLSLASCRVRQQRLADLLRRLDIASALVSDRRHVHYFTGFWQASHHTPILHLTAEGYARLVVPEDLGGVPFTADETIFYSEHRLGTLIEDPAAAAFRAIESSLVTNSRIAVDRPPRHWNKSVEWIDISPHLLALRRAKDPDEVEMIRQAIRGCEAAYARAAEIVRPGVREIDVFAEMQAAAVKAIGEPLGEMGNDFQAGTGGGPPRLRQIQAGELMPLDVAVSFRGYRCDLCRTFVVGGRPSALQSQAADLVLSALDFFERSAEEGVPARWLYDEACKLLRQNADWEFPHHLGHGTGLSVHEAPRLNPHWDDCLTAGDLFTVEPGLYGDDLRGGVRIEENYWLGPHGLEKLSHYPRELVLAGA